MNSETLILQDSTSKYDTLNSWLTILTDFFTNKGFTIAEGDGFGVIMTTDYNLLFGIQVTDNTGIAIYTTHGNDIYGSFALGTYTIVDGVVNVSVIAETSGGLKLNSSASHSLAIHYHITENNKYLDIQLTENNLPFAGYLITPLNDLETTDTSDTCLIGMNNAGYVCSVITPNRVYSSSTTILVEPLTMALSSGRYTCYSCPITVHDTTLRGILPHVKGIKGNFTHAFAQEIILEGKQYYHLGSNIYLPL